MSNIKEFIVSSDNEILTVVREDGTRTTHGLTCGQCIDAPTCKYAGDPYNTDGDCLASK